MKRVYKNRKKKSRVLPAAGYLILFIVFGIVLVSLQSTRTNKFSFGATIPFTPAPVQTGLQLETFTLPSVSPAHYEPQKQTVNPIANENQTTIPSGDIPQGSMLQHVGGSGRTLISPVKSNGQLCSVQDDSGRAVKGSCYCPDLTVTCKSGVGYGGNGRLYPGVNPCGSSTAPGSGRYCVEKPVIYLYPTVPTEVSVSVQTAGAVVVSNPTYPIGGWKNVLARPNGTLQYNNNEYTELFYETSVNNFSKPQQGISIPVNELQSRLSGILDQLGLEENEKQEFLTFWMPKLYALQSPYIFFSILTPGSKAAIDSVTITPKPDTQIDFIAYFKPLNSPVKDSLELPKSPKRVGFTSVEWGGIIGN